MHYVTLTEPGYTAPRLTKPLHHFTRYHTTPHHTTPRCIKLQYTAPHFTASLFCPLHFFALQCMAFWCEWTAFASSSKLFGWDSNIFSIVGWITWPGRIRTEWWNERRSVYRTNSTPPSPNQSFDECIILYWGPHTSLMFTQRIHDWTVSPYLPPGTVHYVTPPSPPPPPPPSPSPLNACHF